MPKIGDKVLFHFVHTSGCFEDCKGEKGCDCIEKRFVCRDAIVMGMSVDSGECAREMIALIDSALAQDDRALMSDVDPTQPLVETVSQRRLRYKTARERLAAEADELEKSPRALLTLDVQFTDQDIADIGNNIEIKTDDGVELRPLTIEEFRKLGRTIHEGVCPATKNPPTDLRESGTWTEAQ